MAQVLEHWLTRPGRELHLRSELGKREDVACSWSWRTIAFVADIFDETASCDPAERRTDLEKTDPEVLRDVVSAVTQLGLNCRHFETPAALAAAAAELEDALILSTYAGGGSRSLRYLTSKNGERHVSAVRRSRANSPAVRK